MPCLPPCRRHGYGRNLPGKPAFFTAPDFMPASSPLHPAPLPAASGSPGTLRRLVPVIVVAIAALGAFLGDFTRHDLIEPVARAAACSESPAPWWCLMRDAIRIAAQNFVLAGIATIAALASLLYRGKTAIGALMAAMFIGGSGLYLYSTSLSAVAVVIALLRAATLDRTG